MRHLTFVGLLLLASPAFARSLDLEIVPDVRAKPAARMLITLEVGDTSCSQIRLKPKVAPVDAVEVCPEKNGFKVKVELAEGDLAASAPSAAGRRTVLWRFDRSDGTRLEVALTPK